MKKKMVISCEHAGNRVPKAYRRLFEHDPAVLETHRGYDIGALELTHTISEHLEVKPYTHPVTRLLVDLNRSLHNPSAFSEYVHPLDKKQRQVLIRDFYEPHRSEVESLISDLIRSGHYVLHLSVHTFTPKLNGNLRRADVGLLFDPTRPLEKRFCLHWKALLEEHSDLKIRLNYPYEGVMDGFSTYLRKQYTSEHYSGIELEVNQKFPEKAANGRWPGIQELLGETVRKAFEKWPEAFIEQ